MSVGGRRLSSASVGLPACAVALGVVALALAANAGVKPGPALDALPDLARGMAAGVVLFAAAGHAVTVRLVPASLRGVRHLLVLPVGAMVASLALTGLGFAQLPLEASLTVVIGAGALASVLTVRGGAEAAPVAARCLAVAGTIALIVGCLTAIPSWRSGIATVPGVNPDAHLVTGIAVLLSQEPPRAHRPGLPVTRMPDVWKSKYPIFYALAGVAELSGLDPIEAFPALSALLAGFVAVGFGLFTVRVLRAPPAAGTLAAAAVGLSPVLLHLPLHPYWNQLWGLATLPFALLFAWHAVADQDARAAALFALTLALGAFAYPLMLPYPLVALAGFALVLRRRPPLASWVAAHWRLAAAGGLAAVALAIPLLGVWEKVRDGVDNLVDPDGKLWTGDLVDFVDLGWFFGVGGGALGAVAVGVFALLALARAVPRPQALALAGLLALSALADVRVRLDDSGAYFDYKHLSFVGPLVVCLAAAGAAWLLARRRAAAVALGAAAIGAWGVATSLQASDELRGTLEQVPATMFELREWSRELPPGASVRLDVPPSGYQLWAAYFMADHPVSAPSPLVNTTYPYVARGARADYSLSLVPATTAALVAPAPPPPAVPPGASPRPLRRNELFVLRRIPRPTGPRTASRDRFY